MLLIEKLSQSRSLLVVDSSLEVKIVHRVGIAFERAPHSLRSRFYYILFSVKNKASCKISDKHEQFEML